MVMMCSRHRRGSNGVMLVPTAAGEETTALDAGSACAPAHAHAHTPAAGAGCGGWDGGGCVVAGSVAARGEEAASGGVVGAGGGSCGDGTAARETMHFGGLFRLVLWLVGCCC